MVSFTMPFHFSPTLVVLVVVVVACIHGNHRAQAADSDTNMTDQCPLVLEANNWTASTNILGALPGQPLPVFCTLSSRSDVQTVQSSSTWWLDDFQHNLSFATMEEEPYNIYTQSTKHAAVWRHANHWMVDAVRMPDQTSIVYVRPNRTFAFDNATNKLVVEFEYAASMADYGSDVWGEVILTTAAGPSPQGRVDGLYGYDHFINHHTLGCRLEAASQHVICAWQAPGRTADNERVYEISFFQTHQARDSVFGGYPTPEDGWRVCRESDPDRLCRDRFRWEVTPTSISVSVNGILYFEQRGLPRLPDELVQSDRVHVYLASVASARTQPQDAVIRWHWDRIAIHPPTNTSDDGQELEVGTQTSTGNCFFLAVCSLSWFLLTLFPG